MDYDYAKAYHTHHFLLSGEGWLGPRATTTEGRTAWYAIQQHGINQAVITRDMRSSEDQLRLLNAPYELIDLWELEAEISQLIHRSKLHHSGRGCSKCESIWELNRLRMLKGLPDLTHSTRKRG